jgi:putative ABC transport system permease protein
MAVAGFTVMAQRRLRSLGMLASLGATDKHVRLVMLADGAAVGVAGAITGGVIGLAAWFAFAPTLQSLSGHRIDRFSSLTTDPNIAGCCASSSAHSSLPSDSFSSPH